MNAAPGVGRPSLRGVARLLTVAAQDDLSRRAAVALELVQIATQVALYALLWEALYDAGQTVGGLDRRAAVTYTTLANLQLFAFYSPERAIREAVRSGSIAYALLRPLGYLWQLLAHDLGGFLWSLVFVGLGVGLAVALGAAAPPPSAAQAGLYALSLLLAFLVQYHLRLLLGLTAFWTVEVWGIRDAFNFGVLLLGGAVVPLWFFPDWALRVATALPFAAVAHAPVSIFVGRLSGADAWRAVGLQVAWAAALAAAAYGVWRRAERRVVVQGG